MSTKIIILVFVSTLALAVQSASEICKGHPHGVLLPNPKDCGSFYQCSHNEAYLIMCPNNLHFSPVTTKCEDPRTVNCAVIDGSDEEPDIPDPEPSEPSEEEPDEEEDSKEPGQGGGENGEFECPADSDWEFFPSEKDCGKYYLCMDGEATKLECDDDLWFNPETEFCDLPENVDCNVSN